MVNLSDRHATTLDMPRYSVHSVYYLLGIASIVNKHMKMCMRMMLFACEIETFT
jgi:hypothetical protein